MSDNFAPSNPAPQAPASQPGTATFGAHGFTEPARDPLGFAPPATEGYPWPLVAAPTPGGSRPHRDGPIRVGPFTIREAIQLLLTIATVTLSFVSLVPLQYGYLAAVGYGANGVLTALLPTIAAVLIVLRRLAKIELFPRFFSLDQASVGVAIGALLGWGNVAALGQIGALGWIGILLMLILLADLTVARLIPGFGVGTASSVATNHYANYVPSGAAPTASGATSVVPVPGAHAYGATVGQPRSAAPGVVTAADIPRAGASADAAGALATPGVSLTAGVPVTSAHQQHSQDVSLDEHTIVSGSRLPAMPDVDTSSDAGIFAPLFDSAAGPHEVEPALGAAAFPAHELLPEPAELLTTVDGHLREVPAEAPAVGYADDAVADQAQATAARAQRHAGAGAANNIFPAAIASGADGADGAAIAPSAANADAAPAPSEANASAGETSADPASSAHTAFWALVPETRPVVDDGGAVLFHIGPDAWALAIEDHKTHLVIRDFDGRVGTLTNVTGVIRN